VVSRHSQTLEIVGKCVHVFLGNRIVFISKGSVIIKRLDNVLGFHGKLVIFSDKNESLKDDF
jgi:hypothetical protein